MKPAPFDRKELDREKAKSDCIKYGTPTLGVDHNNHYQPNPYACTKLCDSDRQCATCTDYSQRRKSNA